MSKAFAKSKLTSVPIFSWTWSDRAIDSVNKSRLELHDLFLRNPCWRVSILSIVWLSNSSYRICSNFSFTENTKVTSSSRPLLSAVFEANI